jgi:hypothetical protein
MPEHDADESLGAVARALLDQERARPASDEGKDRVFAQLGASIELAGAHRGSGVHLRRSFVGHAASIAVALAVGAGGGYWVGSRSAAPASTTIDGAAPPPLRAPSESPAQALSAPPSNGPLAPTAPPTVVPPSPRPRPSPAPSALAPRSDLPERPTPDQALSSERGLLDRGTLALRRGASADALAAVTELRERFPQGQFAEERDALEVLALRQSGRTWEASRAQSDFRRRYPTSALLPNPE